MSVTWKLKKGVEWHDGRPFTADDVVFNWEYASDPATAAVTRQGRSIAMPSPTGIEGLKPRMTSPLSI
jgi:ABC-type transport system substrate-binding protein